VNSGDSILNSPSSAPASTARAAGEANALRGHPAEVGVIAAQGRTHVWNEKSHNCHRVLDFRSKPSIGVQTQRRLESRVARH